MAPTRLLGVPEPVTVRVPAKVNLHLSVGPARKDGYHELVTVFHAISLYDELTATPARDLSIGISGEGADELSPGEDNLAWKAAVLLAERAGVPPAVRLDLVKGIPVAGGLAGGSADAAATLVACDALWGAGLDRAELLELAAELGSDVAFALTGGTALGTGRGERLTPVLAAGRWHWVLAVAGEGLSTPDVYGELDRLRASTEQPVAGAPDRLINALRVHDAGCARPAAGQRPAGAGAGAAAGAAPHVAGRRRPRCARRGRLRLRADLRVPVPVPGGGGPAGGRAGRRRCLPDGPDRVRTGARRPGGRRRGRHPVSRRGSEPGGERWLR